MKLYFKKYQNDKALNILKKDRFLLFSINANQNSNHWLTLEQNINKLAIAYTKVYNSAVKKTFEKSIFKNFKNLIGGTFFFLKPKKIQKIKNTIITSLNEIQFTIIVTKLNKKLFSNRGFCPFSPKRGVFGFNFSNNRYCSVRNYWYKKSTIRTEERK